jgi:putative inorganic carbon (hco3(-)) transporter
LILVGCSAVILAGVAFSFSRGAWLGVTVGLIVTFTVALRRFWLPAVAMAPLAVLLLVFVSAATPDALAGRLSSISAEARPFDASSATIDEDNFATVERMAHWQAGLAMFRDHPISGVGPGNYNVMYPDYFVRTDFRISQGHAHNYYVHALAETGAVGLLLYVLLLVVFLVLALRVSLRETGIAQAIALGALGTTTAVMVHNVFENLHVLNLGVQISATWALALAAYRSSRPNRKSVGVDVE